ncbi:MAG TPA: NEW3 domain-containing protein [archaeon]|nr:NEW3 domain-containing protein [archaeon]
MKYLAAAFLLVFSVFSALAFAETNDSLNVSQFPQPVVSGGLGYTAGNCTQNYGYPPSGCATYQCFFENGSTARGSCRPPSNTDCYESGLWYSSSYNGPYCKNSTHVYSCSSGAWAATPCSNSCSSGSCSNTTTTTAPGGGNDPGNTPAAKKYTLSITSSIQSFNITQNKTASKSVTVKNTGEDKTNNTKLQFSGIPDGWALVSPLLVGNLSIGSSATFTINFIIPADAGVKEYDVTVTAKSDQAETSGSFKLKVLPSTATVQNVIIPRYDSLWQRLQELENNVSALKSSGANTTDMESILANMRTKINETNASISSSDYFAASTAMDEIDALAADLVTKINAGRAAQGSGTIIMTIAVVAIIALGVLGYMFLPAKLAGVGKAAPWKKDYDKGGFQPGRGFSAPSEASQVSKILSDIQRRKKEKVRYQFGGQK